MSLRKLELNWFSERLEIFYNLMKSISFPELLKEKIIYTYSLDCAEQLAFLLEQIEKKTIDQQLYDLKYFLKKNWRFVQGSMLSYTALPKHELSILLSELAQFIAKIENEKRRESFALNAGDDAHKEEQILQDRPLGALEILMPGVSLESLFPDEYRHLYPIQKENGAQEKIWEDINLSEVLATHILGRNNTYLIPLIFLAKYTGRKEFTSKANPYFDFVLHSDEYAYLNEEEYERLGEYSPLTRALFNAQQQFELLIQDNSNLLTQLNQLCRAMYFNSVEGIGSEENSGEEAYVAIVKFTEYYDHLTKDQLDKIPEALMREIKILLEQTEKKNNIFNYDSCLATRRTNLMNAMRHHEVLLSELSIDPSKKTELIQQAGKSLDELKCDWLKKLKEPEGEDALPLNILIMEELNLAWHLGSKEDLKVLSTLSSAEILEIFSQNEHLQEESIWVLNNLENFILFCIELSPHRLKAYLASCMPALSKEFLNEINDLADLLFSLDLERSEIICQSLLGSLPEILVISDDFSSLFSQLNEEKCDIVFKAFRAYLPQLIASSMDFNVILYSLEEEQRSLVFEDLGKKLFTLIANGRDFNLVMSPLAQEQRSLVFETFQSRLLTIILSSQDFIDVSSILTEEQAGFVFSTLEENLFNLIKHSRDFSAVLGILSEDQANILFKALRSRLSSLIKTSNDFVLVMGSLNPKQRALVFEDLLQALPLLVETIDDFSNIMWPLSVEQRVVLFKPLFPLLIAGIANARDFGLAMGYLEVDQRTLIFKALFDNFKLPTFISSSSHLKLVIKYLNPEQIQVLLEALRPRLIYIVESSYSFKGVCDYLKQEHCRFLIEALGVNLLNMTKNSLDFGLIMQVLSAQNRDLIFKRGKAYFPALIHSSDNFNSIMKYLSTEQFQIILDALRPRLDQLIHSFPGLLRALRDLNSNCIQLLLEALALHLPVFIKDSQSLQLFLTTLNTDLHAFILKLMQPSLPKIISDIDGFNRVVSVLSAECREIFFQAVRKFLPQFIKKGNEFFSVLEHLPVAQRRCLFELFYYKLPKMPFTLESYIAIFQLLPDDLCLRFAWKIKDRASFKENKDTILSLIPEDRQTMINHKLILWDNSFSTCFWQEEAQSETNEKEAERLYYPAL